MDINKLRNTAIVKLSNRELLVLFVHKSRELLDTNDYAPVNHTLMPELIAYRNELFKRLGEWDSRGYSTLSNREE